MLAQGIFSEEVSSISGLYITRAVFAFA